MKVFTASKTWTTSEIKEESAEAKNRQEHNFCQA